MGIGNNIYKQTSAISNVHAGKPKKHESIAVCIYPYYIGFLVFDTQIKQIVSFSTENYTHTELVLTRVNQKISGYQKSRVSIVQKAFTLIPSTLQNAISLETIWKQNYGEKAEFLVEENLDSTRLIALSNFTKSPYDILKNSVFEVKTEAFYTLSYLVKNTGVEPSIFLKKYNGYIQLYLFNKGNLMLANQFDTAHENDICYYTLLSAEKLSLDLEKTTLWYIANNLSFEKEESILTDYISNIKQHPFDPYFEYLTQTIYI